MPKGGRKGLEKRMTSGQRPLSVVSKTRKRQRRHASSETQARKRGQFYESWGEVLFAGVARQAHTRAAAGFQLCRTMTHTVKVITSAGGTLSIARTSSIARWISGSRSAVGVRNVVAGKKTEKSALGQRR